MLSDMPGGDNMMQPVVKLTMVNVEDPRLYILWHVRCLIIIHVFP